MTLPKKKSTSRPSCRSILKCGVAALSVALTPAVMTAQDGSTAYNYLNVTSSARIYGLGGVNISTVEDELGTADQNPGLLGFEMDNQVMVDYMRYLGNSNFAGVKYARAVGERGAWSAGIRYFGYGEMKAADATGVITGTFSPKDLNFSGTFSYDITSRLRGGISMKLLYSSYEEYSAFAVTTDLGINYFDPDTDWSFSAVVANLGGQLKKFNENYDRLPVDVRLGATKDSQEYLSEFRSHCGTLQNGSFPIMTAATAPHPNHSKRRSRLAPTFSGIWCSELISCHPTVFLSLSATTTRPAPT